MASAEQISLQASSLKSRLVALQRGLIKRAMAERAEGRVLDWDGLFREAFELSSAMEQVAWIEAAVMEVGRVPPTSGLERLRCSSHPPTRRRDLLVPGLEGKVRIGRTRRAQVGARHLGSSPIGV